MTVRDSKALSHESVRKPFSWNSVRDIGVPDRRSSKLVEEIIAAERVAGKTSDPMASNQCLAFRHFMITYLFSLKIRKELKTIYYLTIYYLQLVIFHSQEPITPA